MVWKLVKRVPSSVVCGANSYTCNKHSFPGGSEVKASACGRPGFNPWVGKIPWRRKWQPTPAFLPGESHGQRSLEGCIVHGVTKSQKRLSDFTFTFTFQDKRTSVIHPLTKHIHMYVHAFNIYVCVCMTDL